MKKLSYDGKIRERKFAPLPTLHPLVGQICPACRRAFEADAVLTLVSVGPGDDPEQQKKCREGRPYNAAAIAVHWTCHTGEK